MTLDHPIRRSLLIAAAWLLMALMLKELGRRSIISAETIERVTGVLMGALVVFYANAIPKTLVPLARLSCHPARDQALRRFGGWALVLGGMGFMLAQALAPAGIANTLSVCLLAPAVVVVCIAVGASVWAHRRAG